VDLEGVISTMGQIGRHRGYALVLRDVTQHEATTRALAESEERLRVVIDQSPVAVLAFDKDLTITECNGLLSDMLGSPREGLVGEEITPRSVPDLYGLCRVALEGETSSFEGPIGREGDDEHWMQCRVSPLYDGGAISGGMCVAWDVTGAKRAEALIEALAFRDTLTGLPNRSLYRDRLRQAVEEAQANGSRVAVGILGLDRFKTVSEAMGHGVADELLQHLAGRLETLVRKGDTLARVAGDELAFIMPNLTEASLRRLGEEILAAAREPVMLGGRSLSVTGSLGLAVYPGDAADAYELLENAQRALCRARDAGGDRHRVYDLSMNLEAAERLDIEQGLRTALDEQQLVVYYEPQVNLEDGSILAVEALVRWNHPTRGLLPPMMFIPVAEESGQISRLGEWVLRQACSEMAAFAAESGSDLRLAVNVSPMELRDADLPRNVARILAETGFNPSRLDIELTETAVIADFEATRGALEELRALGVSVVLDDFGTGYASLTHLHGLPIDKVKVDRSFVMRCEEDGDAASIVAALVSLAHTLNLGVVAEGVDAVGQVAFLRELGCDEGQGYLFAAAAPPAECPAFACLDGVVNVPA
jgi:diguanylate cyclase (GGDEF)-like protein/PAS domain S-box-containing protein